MTKLFIAFATALLLVGCAKTASNGVDEPSAADPQPVVNEPNVSAGIVGSWENSSCGERKFLRKINFLKDGNFAATDLVAPCPAGAVCMWSGIIDWTGTWTLNESVITLTTVIKKDSKPPETMPSEFVVLSDNPVSIGERETQTVCPYKRAQ